MDTFLIAAGGHGRVILDSALSQGLLVNGIIDKLQMGEQIFGIKILGDDSFLDSLDPKSVQLLNGFGFIKSLDLRINKYTEWLNRGFTVIGVRHPSVVISRELSYDISSQILAGVVIQNRVKLGKNVVINTRCSIDHDVSIGNHSFISPGVVICGGVSVGEKVFIGAGAIILPSVSLGDNSIVPAGSIVKKDLEANTKYNN
jgi:sugar O-acyltransferase (sialic acid O-acetyltransferase NeuD family)